MATLTKTWSFDSDSDGFALVNCSWSGGQILTTASGRNTSVNATSSITTSFNSIGVPSGASINSVQLKFDHACTAYSASDFANISASLTTSGTSISQINYSGTSSIVTASSGINSANEPSSNSFTISLSINVDNANDKNALTSVVFDNVQLIVEYTLADPIIAIQSFTRSKISDEVGFTASTVIFQVDTGIDGWEARATIDSETPSQGVGDLVGSGSSALANNDISFEVDYTELIDGDRQYIITIYVQVGGVWYG